MRISPHNARINLSLTCESLQHPHLNAALLSAASLQADLVEVSGPKYTKSARNQRVIPAEARNGKATLHKRACMPTRNLAAEAVGPSIEPIIKNTPPINSCPHCADFCKVQPCAFPIITSSAGNKFVSRIKSRGGCSVCSGQKWMHLKMAGLKIGLAVEAPYEQDPGMVP